MLPTSPRGRNLKETSKILHLSRESSSHRMMHAVLSVAVVTMKMMTRSCSVSIATCQYIRAALV